MKITGWNGEPSLDDFAGLVIHSDMEELGHIETSDPLINQLFHNAWWGMKGNFLDVPTDCPQRDERYGWTGDAQIFSGTACYNMDTYAFYTKFGKDLYEEQKKLNGSVPDVVPVANCPGDASTAWADAATIIPWNVYLHSGDPGILLRQYDSMNDMAYRLLMEKGYPGWLYQITIGATTVWERWNSILPDGSISGTGMNSLNHYSYGSIVEWMYRDMLGIVPLEENPGFKSFCVAPKPNYRIQWAKANVRTMAGTIESSWEIRGKELLIRITVPFDAKAHICLPDAALSDIEKQLSGYGQITELCQAGEYFTYVKHLPFFDELYTLRELMNGPFTNVPYEQQEKIDRLLRSVIKDNN